MNDPIKQGLKLFEFRVGSDLESGVIGLQDFYDQTHLKYIRTREKAVFDELIKLGWTPPKPTNDKVSEEVISNPINPADLLERIRKLEAVVEAARNARIPADREREAVKGALAALDALNEK